MFIIAWICAVAFFVLGIAIAILLAVTSQSVLRKQEAERAQAAAPEQYSMNVDPDTGEIISEVEESDE